MKKQFYFIALKKLNNWSANDQYLIQANNWNSAVDIANAVSLINDIEVRLSDSQGFNNQGHYFLNSCVQTSGQFKK
jgi:hypothetical protein